MHSDAGQDVEEKEQKETKNRGGGGEEVNKEKIM
jgi:hypothetical protein